MPQNPGLCQQVEESNGDSNGVIPPPNCQQPQQEDKMPDSGSDNMNQNETATELKRHNITVIHIHVVDNSEESKSSDSSSSSSESKSDERPLNCNEGSGNQGIGCKPMPPPAETNKNETDSMAPKKISKRSPIGPVSLSVSLERIRNLSSPESDSSESVELEFSKRCTPKRPCFGRRKRQLMKNLF